MSEKELQEKSAADASNKPAAEPTVTMIFPKDLIVNPDGNHIHFKAGPNEVPVSLKDNWYLKANGVKLYEKPSEKLVAPVVPPANNEPQKPAEPQQQQAPAVVPVDLTALTKEKLIEHAAEVHGLELKPALTKDQLIAAIQEKQAAPKV